MMFKRRSSLPEEFHMANRHLKQEMLEQGIRRPHWRIMIVIAVLGASAAIAGAGLSLLGFERASWIFFAGTVVLSVALVTVQQSPRFGQFVKKEGKKKINVSTDALSGPSSPDDTK